MEVSGDLPRTLIAKFEITFAIACLVTTQSRSAASTGAKLVIDLDKAQ